MTPQDKEIHTEEVAGTLRESLLAHGAALVGFADLSDVPEDVRPPLTRAVVIGVALDPAVIDGIRQGPTQAYFDLYNRVNAHLVDLCDCAARLLEQAGRRAVTIPPTVGKDGVDLETFSTALPHKMAATRAGLGWVGKCALLVTPAYGSGLRLATVLTDADLPFGAPIDESRCGDCTDCVDVCPGHAPSGKQWDVATHRDAFFDARACALAILAQNTGFGFICGMCIAACPWTERYVERKRA